MKTLARQFQEQLLKLLTLDPGQSLSSAKWAGTGNTIGALALRLGLMTIDQIEHVLEYQSKNPELFGHIATNLDYLNESQVEKIVELQKVHHLLEVAEQYYLHSNVPLIDLLNLTTQYYSQHAGNPVLAAQ